MKGKKNKQTKFDGKKNEYKSSSRSRFEEIKVRMNPRPRLSNPPPVVQQKNGGIQ